MDALVAGLGCSCSLGFSTIIVRYSLTELGLALAKRLESEEGGEEDRRDEEKKSEPEDSGDGPVTVDLTLDEDKEEHEVEDCWWE